MGDWVLDCELLGVLGLDELAVDKVFVDSGESVPVEACEKGHKFQLEIKIKIAISITYLEFISMIKANLKFISNSEDKVKVKLSK